MCKSGIPLKDVKSSEWNYSGIYKITNIVNGKCYIGQSINIKQRLIKHYNNFLNHQEANSQEELEDRVKHYFENDRFQQKNQKF